MKPSAQQPFDPAAFDAHMAQDATLRTLMIAVAIVAGVVTVLLPGLGLVATMVAPAVLLGLWFWLSVSTTRVGRVLPAIGEALHSDPQRAQTLIDEALKYWPVMQWARLLTYHRLAALRHIQRRHFEAASLCLCLLNQPLRGPAAAARPHLLLMLAESQLETGNLPGAYHALAHLQQTRLGLAESLQRMAIQTRYELAVGAHSAALRRSREKVQLSELMPATHCATMHAMLATAAHRSGQARLADWLWQRTRLMAPPALLPQFERGVFGVGVVEHDSAVGTEPA